MPDIFSITGCALVVLFGAVATGVFAVLLLPITKVLDRDVAAGVSVIAGMVWYLAGLREWVLTTLATLIVSALSWGGAFLSVAMWGVGCAVAWWLLGKIAP